MASNKLPEHNYGVVYQGATRLPTPGDDTIVTFTNGVVLRDPAGLNLAGPAAVLMGDINQILHPYRQFTVLGRREEGQGKFVRQQLGLYLCYPPQIRFEYLCESGLFFKGIKTSSTDGYRMLAQFKAAVDRLDPQLQQALPKFQVLAALTSGPIVAPPPANPGESLL